MQNNCFRPEIEGLRAIAVLSVIINHFGRDVLPSGFLGVDVFFVISGYVITSSIFRRPNMGVWDFLVNFYSRRVRRLLPALAVCVLVTGAAAIFLVPDPDVSIKTGLYALFGFSNVHLYLMASDYYAPEAALNTFTQTWSLGVEEQFYLLFPILIWMVSAGKIKEKGRLIGHVVFFISLISLISFAYLYNRNQAAAFYLLPMRAWELGVGCIIFLAMQIERVNQSFAQARVSLISFAGLLSLMFLPERYAPWATIAAVFTVCILVLSVRAEDFSYRILTVPVVLYVGKISYSLYLWHWSVLSIGRWVVSGDEWWIVMASIFLVFGLALLSYHCVESPLRNAKPALRKGFVVISGFVINILISFLLIGMLWGVSGLKNEANAQDIKYPPLFLPLKNSGLPFNPTCVVDEKRPWAPEKFDLCTVSPKEKGGRTIWVLGDSHANHLQGLLYGLHDKIGVGVHLIGTPGVPFPVRRTDPVQPREEIYQRVSERLKAGDIVMIARIFINRDGFAPIDPPGWSEDVALLAAQLRSKNVNLVIMGPLPIFSFLSVKECSVSQGKKRPCLIERSLIEAGINFVYKSLYNLAKGSDNIHVFNPFEILCPGDVVMCSPVKNGIAIFYDRDHLNVHGAASLTDSFIGFMDERRLK